MLTLSRMCLKMIIYLRPYLVTVWMVLHSGLLGAATHAALKAGRIHEIEVVHILWRCYSFGSRLYLHARVGMT